MEKIIKRNLVIFKKNCYYNIFFIIFFTILFKSQNLPTGVLGLTVPIVSYTSMQILAQVDDYYKYDVILNSLPLSRAEIMNGKYKSMLIIIAINTVATVAIQLVFNILTVSEIMGGIDFIFSLSLSLMLAMVMCSVYVFSVLKLGYEKSRIIGCFVFAFVFGSTAGIAGFAIENSSLKLVLSIILIAIGILTYSVFKGMAVKLYQEREF